MRRYTCTTYDFMENYRNVSFFISLILTPDFHLTYSKNVGNLGSLLYGDVSVMGSSSYLQVTRTSITSRTSSKFGQIGPRTAELAALERLEK